LTSEGTMAGGEFIDVMIFVDWLEARMRESIFFRLVNTKKIPYTQAGVTIIENEIRRVLAEGIAGGGLAPNPQPTVSVPNVLATTQIYVLLAHLKVLPSKAVLQAQFTLLKFAEQ